MVGLQVFLCIIALVALSNGQPRPKHLPDFALQETGRFIRSYSLTLGRDPDEFYFMADATAQRAYVKIANAKSGVVGGEHWLIWQPENAAPGSEESKGFVQFLVQDANPWDNDPESFCEFKSGAKVHFGSGMNYPPVAFPDHWDRNDVVKVKSWIEVPERLSYQGVVTENSMSFDIWISRDLCSETDFGTLPCDKLAFLKDSNIPTGLFIAEESGSFRSSWWLDDKFLYYETRSAPITPPLNWRTTCFNTRNGFNLSTYGRAFVATPSTPDTFTIQLNIPPVSELGPVHVFFMFDGETCTDCIAFEDKDENPVEEIVFDETNWDVPVTVNVYYLKEGETYFYILGYGGGYEIPHYGAHFMDGKSYTVSQGSRALTCKKGKAGYGCDD
eukprot:TRINITY_DN1462_c0_g1_i1.p1 TRINITY_DN1462_c0_g1~~TRINITY_DN1462_c0_g1_i1.p1  ORF type:complete len:387 (-),score=48.91 TRINITY_DN1462_c0_g1_i1:101-1261(-)